MTDIVNYLDRLGIAYQRVEHPAVFTVAEAQQLVPPLPGMPTKNLFLRDRRGQRHFLVVLPEDSKTDLATLALQLQADKLSFASLERLAKYLGVAPGAVSLLGIVNDIARIVEVWMAPECYRAERLLCHPLVNTATLSIAAEDIQRFAVSTGHKINVL